MTEKRVRVIPPFLPILSAQTAGALKKRKVAAYARVSTDREEQQNSYDAQVDYYTQFIQRNPEWEFVEVYAYENVTGTNTKKRDGFKSIIQDALLGKMGLILTKSVSRLRIAALTLHCLRLNLTSRLLLQDYVPAACQALPGSVFHRTISLTLNWRTDAYLI